MAMSGIGLAAALALWLWWLPADEVVEVASGKANAKAGLQSTGSPASLVWPTPSTPAISIAAPPVPLSVLPFATTGFAPITVAAPQKLQVGEMNELVVAVGANGEHIADNVQCLSMPSAHFQAVTIQCGTFGRSPLPISAPARAPQKLSVAIRH